MHANNGNLIDSFVSPICYSTFVFYVYVNVCVNPFINLWAEASTDNADRLFNRFFCFYSLEIHACSFDSTNVNLYVNRSGYY